MNKVLCVSALTLAMAAVGMAQPASDLPTVDQILAKSIEAGGGKAAEEKLTSRVMKGTIEVVTFSVSGPTEIYAKAPNKQFTRSEFAGFGEVLQGYDGKVAWANSPDAGLRELSGAELERVKRSSDFYRGLHFKEQYPKMTVTGKVKVGERDAYLLEAQPAEGAAEKFYFDAQTGMLIRNDFPGQQGGQASLYLEDFKEVDGVKIAHTLRLESPDISLIIKIAQVQHNVAIDDAKFVKPAK